METAFKVEIKATSPCAKFYDANLRDQVQKIKEEVLEVENALELFLDAEDSEKAEGVAIDLLVEMFDVVACINTLQAQLKYRYPDNFNEARTMAAELMVINKNMARGYYAPEV